MELNEQIWLAEITYMDQGLLQARVHFVYYELFLYVIEVLQKRIVEFLFAVRHCRHLLVLLLFDLGPRQFDFGNVVFLHRLRCRWSKIVWVPPLQFVLLPCFPALPTAHLLVRMKRHFVVAVLRRVVIFVRWFVAQLNRAFKCLYILGSPRWFFFHILWSLNI